MRRSIIKAIGDQRAGRITAEALTEEALGAARAHEPLNAFAILDPDRALAAARERDLALAAGHWAGPLHGIPLTIKDLFEVDGLPTRAGTRAPLPPLGGEGTAVRRLRAAGAVIIGKTNMHEVALGLSGENSWTGDVRNPHDPSRRSGGSSSGSAVAVAVGAGLGSLGTDTGGSIRVPSALCGVAGFKPSYGLVPFDGALPLAPTCDHPGPIASDMTDVRLLTEVLAGRPFAPAAPQPPPRLGVPRAFLEGRLATAMRSAFDAATLRLQKDGAEIVDVGIDAIEEIVPNYTALVRAEGAFVHRAALESRPEDFSELIRPALLGGLALSAVDYLAARAYRRRLQAGLATMFDRSGVTALILPATPAPAQLRGSETIELQSGSFSWREPHIALTGPFSFAGVPAAAVPFATIDGLPAGLQVVSPFGKDGHALDVAAWIEAAFAFDPVR